jgi:hypothetical protein
LLEQIADELKIDIIAESYYEKPRQKSATQAYVLMNTVPKGETTIETALDRIVAPRAGYWQKQGSAYLIQKRYWWEARACQVPDSTMTRLRTIFKVRGDKSLDDWGEVGSLLRKEQLGIVEAEGVAPLLGLIDAKLPLLTFYGSLSPMQRASVFSPVGLPWRNLRKEDRTRLVAWIGPAHQAEDIPWNQVKTYAFARPASPPLERTIFRVVLVASDGSEQLLRELVAPGDPPARYRARELRQVTGSR